MKMRLNAIGKLAQIPQLARIGRLIPGPNLLTTLHLLCCLLSRSCVSQRKVGQLWQYVVGENALTQEQDQPQRQVFANVEMDALEFKLVL